MRHADDHSHIRAHDHDLCGPRQTEDYAARQHPEFVALEIGGEVGALIVHTDPDMHGVEVEISPDHADSERSHKQVLERSANGRAAFTLVFDRLPAGTYTLWTDGRARAGGITIDGGSITQLDWTDTASHPASARSRARAGFGSTRAPDRAAAASAS